MTLGQRILGAAGIVLGCVLLAQFFAQSYLMESADLERETERSARLLLAADEMHQAVLETRLAGEQLRAGGTSVFERQLADARAAFDRASNECKSLVATVSDEARLVETLIDIYSGIAAELVGHGLRSGSPVSADSALVSHAFERSILSDYQKAHAALHKRVQALQRDRATRRLELGRRTTEAYLAACSAGLATLLLVGWSIHFRLRRSLDQASGALVRLASGSDDPLELQEPPMKEFVALGLAIRKVGARQQRTRAVFRSRTERVIACGQLMVQHMRDLEVGILQIVARIQSTVTQDARAAHSQTDRLQQLKDLSERILRIAQTIAAVDIASTARRAGVTCSGEDPAVKNEWAERIMNSARTLESKSIDVATRVACSGENVRAILAFAREVSEHGRSIRDLLSQKYLINCTSKQQGLSMTDGTSLEYSTLRNRLVVAADEVCQVTAEIAQISFVQFRSNVEMRESCAVPEHELRELEGRATSAMEAAQNLARVSLDLRAAVE